MGICAVVGMQIDGCPKYYYDYRRKRTRTSTRARESESEEDGNKGSRHKQTERNTCESLQFSLGTRWIGTMEHMKADDFRCHSFHLPEWARLCIHRCLHFQPIPFRFAFRQKCRVSFCDRWRTAISNFDENGSPTFRHRMQASVFSPVRTRTARVKYFPLMFYFVSSFTLFFFLLFGVVRPVEVSNMTRRCGEPFDATLKRYSAKRAIEKWNKKMESTEQAGEAWTRT